MKRTTKILIFTIVILITIGVGILTGYLLFRAFMT